MVNDFFGATDGCQDFTTFLNFILLLAHCLSDFVNTFVLGSTFQVGSVFLIRASNLSSYITCVLLTCVADSYLNEVGATNVLGVNNALKYSENCFTISRPLTCQIQVVDNSAERVAALYLFKLRPKELGRHSRPTAPHHTTQWINRSLARLNLNRREAFEFFRHHIGDDRCSHKHQKEGK